MELEELIKRFQNFNAVQAADRVIKKNAEFAIDLSQGQMIRGKMPDGSQIGAYQSPFYAEFKNLRNPLAGFGVVDLNLTGDYYKGMILTGKYPNYEIISKDGKAQELESKYGDPLGINKSNEEKFRNKNDKDYVTNEIAPLFK